MNEDCMMRSTCSAAVKYPERCMYCVSYSQYIQAKEKKPAQLRQYKKSNRTGATFEENVNQKNKTILSSVSGLTPNSGAGTIKGDIQIDGLVTMMMELKTKIVLKTSRGSETFTIKKEWLNELKKNAAKENKEFWVLTFNFLESEKDWYTVMSYEELMQMTATMSYDRKEAKLIKAEKELLESKFREKEIEILKLEAEKNTLLKEIELMKLKADKK